MEVARVDEDATQEGSAMGYLSLPYSQEQELYPGFDPASDDKIFSDDLAVIPRRKRNIFFPSGIKLCAQETAEQVAANHLSYFYLRVVANVAVSRLKQRVSVEVCQETIWEAFKIFWDRLPEQDEYQSWMSKCQEGAVTAQDVGTYFSQSEEHQALVKKRTAAAGSRSEPTRSWQHMCSTPAPEAAKTIEAPELEPKKEKELEDVSKEEMGEQANDIVPVLEESSLDNDIAIQPPTPAALEQVVKLSILLTGEVFNNNLDDPSSTQYQTLSSQLGEKITDALEELPGFKSVTVLSFRPETDVQGQDGVMVDFAVSLVVDGNGASNEQMDYLTLQSNLVENSYREVMELKRPTVYTISEIKNFVTEAMQPPELESVSEVPESFNTAGGEGGEAVVKAADEPQEVMIIKEDNEDVNKEDVLRTLQATAENDVIVLEESTVVSPAPVLTTAAPEVRSIAEEGLLLKEGVNSPPTKEIPDVLLPKPPLEVESSGSGTDDLVATTVASTISEAATESVEIIAVLEEPTAALSDGEDENEIDEEEAENPEELETIEEGLPAVVPPPEAVDVVSEAPELKPHSEVPVIEESGIDEITHREEVKEESVPEAPAEEEKAAEAPAISTEDLTEDEIILVNSENTEVQVAGAPNPPQPTALSPEKESPFTRISDVKPIPEGQPDIIIPSGVEIQTINEIPDDATAGDQEFDLIQYGYGLINHTEDGSTSFPFGVAHGTDQVSIAMPANPGRALMVFFSLRVTNMIFSEDLFNKSSPEYKALEQRFLELLVPYLQSNLSNFENLEILNFRNGSIVVNSRMKFGKPVQQGVTSTVYLILEDFCNTAYQTMNLAIDKYSLDVESGDKADPCKFQACNEYAECKVNKWSGEAECVCNAGYFSMDGLPCQSICELQTDFCLNDGKCDIIPGQGAICRCRVGENWWYRGEHCEEYVSEPLVVGIAIASVAGFLLVASGVIFFLARTLRDQYDKDESEDPIRRAESLPSLERATKYNPMYESEATTGYSHYYRRYPEAPVYSSASAEASTDFSSEEIRHIYENSELTKEEIQDRIRIIELYAKDRQFADFVRQHQAALDTRRESSSTQGGTLQ
ncbi:interphotoreceptor matrix proteoglycan 2 [Cheilinus undulatus]|uniref:interphotoreceptor matrix proteoglycan 2 n=1 Tax=Cheilinus undulatus TaxID=241271 RepID=UPI001BD3A246|nr:interphotoreceptor matrix proteoglycan 2 [Cheilinus undulatus]